MSERKAIIKNADMGEEMQQDAIDCATAALEKFNIEKVSKSFLKAMKGKKKTEYIVRKYHTNKMNYRQKIEKKISIFNQKREWMKKCLIQ